MYPGSPQPAPRQEQPFPAYTPFPENQPLGPGEAIHPADMAPPLQAGLPESRLGQVSHPAHAGAAAVESAMTYTPTEDVASDYARPAPDEVPSSPDAPAPPAPPAETTRPRLEKPVNPDVEVYDRILYDPNQDPEFNKRLAQPVEGRIVDEVNHGDGSSLSLRVKRYMDGGPLVIKTSPALRALGGVVHQEGEESLTDRPVTTQMHDFSDHDTPMEYWVNIWEKRSSDLADKEDPRNDTAVPMDLHEMIDSDEGYGAWEVVVEGVPVPAPAVAHVAEEAGTLTEDLTNTDGKDGDVDNMEHFQHELSLGKATAALRRIIRVGGRTPEEAVANARRISGSVLPSQGDTRWPLETDEDNRIIVYPSEEQSIEAAHEAADAAYEEERIDPSLVSAKRFRDLIYIPNDREMPDVPRKARRSFPVNQEFEKGEDVIPFGFILQDGKAVKPAGLPVKDVGANVIIIGRSGSGKTAAALRMIIETARKFPNMTKVNIDFKKEGNYGHALSELALKLGLSEEDATVRLINPNRTDEPLACFNPFALNGRTPIQVSRDVRAEFTATIKEEDQRRILGTHMEIGMRIAFMEQGFAPKTGESTRKYATQPDVTMADFRRGVVASIVHAGYDPEAQARFIGWVDTQITDTTGGEGGQIVQTGQGYDLSAAKMRAIRGYTTMELASLGKLREMVLASYMRLMSNQLKSEQDTPGDVDELKVMTLMDETGRVLEAESDSTDNWTHLRGRGMGSVVMQQRKNLAADVDDNSRVRLLFGTSSADTVREMAEGMGNGVPVTDIQDFANTARPGQALLHSSSTPNGPVQLGIPRNPSVTGKGGIVKGPGELVDQKYDLELYLPAVHLKAEQILRETIHGNDVAAWAESAVQAMMYEDPLPLAKMELIEALGPQPGDTEEEAAAKLKVRDRLITQAAYEKCKQHPDLENVKTQKEYVEWLRDEMLDQVHNPDPNRERSLAPVDFAVVNGRFGRPLRKLEEVLKPSRMPIPRYELDAQRKATNQETQIFKDLGLVGGLTAEDQRDFVRNVERATLSQAASVLFKEISQRLAGRENPEAVTQITTMFKRLTTGSTPEFTEQMRQALRKPTMEGYERVVQNAAPEAREQAQQVYDAVQGHVETILTAVTEAEDPKYGYPWLQAQLEARLAEAAKADAVDLSEFNGLYKDADGNDIPMPSHTRTEIVNGEEVVVLRKAEEQKADLLRMRAEAVAAADYEVHDADIYFSVDGMDAIVGRIMNKENEKGKIHAELDIKLNNGKPLSVGLTDLVAADDPRREDWQRAITGRVLYENAGFTLDPHVVIARRRGYADEIDTMKQRAQERREFIEGQNAKVLARAQAQQTEKPTGSVASAAPTNSNKVQP
jgi:hypothetical protein